MVTFANLILLISSEEVLVGFKSNCVYEKIAICAIKFRTLFFLLELTVVLSH